MIDLIFSIIFEYILFNIGKCALFIISIGKVNPTYDDKPFSSLVVSLLGLIVIILIIILIMYIIGASHG
jgi:ABC-type transport system involved in multi-copper enzyme maturation permease subunit